MEKIISCSQAMEQVKERIKKFAPKNAPILITGESGTGKELVSRIIHEISQRKGKIKVVNCSAISKELVESELFGHVKGAFTGATNARKGIIRAAENGTLLLDEIGDMPLPAQTKLLRVVENKEVSPVGSDNTFPVNVRIVTATNQNLKLLIKEGKFRKDLYYRINILNINIPPLRERKEDIALLLKHFFEMFCQEYEIGRLELKKMAISIFLQIKLGIKEEEGSEELFAKAAKILPAEKIKMIKNKEDIFDLYYGIERQQEENFFQDICLKYLLQKSLQCRWPGNVRELSAAVQRSVILGKIDFPCKEEETEISFSPEPQVSLSHQKRRERRLKQKNFLKKIILEKYQGRIILAQNDPEILSKIGRVNLSNMISLLGLREETRQAREKFLNENQKEILRLLKKKKKSELAKYFGISNKEFGQFLKKIN